MIGVLLGPGFWSFQVCPVTFGDRARTMGEPTTERMAKARRVRGGHRGWCTKLGAEANMIVGRALLPENQGIRLSPEEASRLVAIDSMLAKQLARLEKMDTEILAMVCFLELREEDVEKEFEQAGMISVEVESACQIISSTTASSKTSKRDEESGSRNQEQEPGEASDSESPSSDDEKEDVKPRVVQGSKSVLAANPGVGRDLWRQLKPVAIPAFKGDKGSFPAWKAAFMACVDQAPVTREYKLLQLRSYLNGEALAAIEPLGHSATAYDSALERLERKFGGERRLFAA